MEIKDMNLIEYREYLNQVIAQLKKMSVECHAHIAELNDTNAELGRTQEFLNKENK